MELFYYLIRLVLSLDNRFLRPLRYWVPDSQQVLNSPREYFQAGAIEIGPWTRHVRRVLVPILLIFPVCVVAVLADALAPDAFARPIAICALVAWPVLAVIVILGGRGGRCFIRADGVEFRYRGVAVFCAWDLFHAVGQPIFYEAKFRLDLPVQHAAIKNIKVRKNDTVIAEGEDSQTSHFQILATDEIRLKIVYGVGHGPGEMTFILTFSGLLGSLGLGWFFAAKRASAVAAPLHLSDFRPGHGTIQIRFRNRNYAEQFAGVKIES